MKDKVLSTKIRVSIKAMSFVLLSCQASISQAEVLNSTTPITPQNMVTQMGAGVDATWSEVPNKIADYTPQATVEFANKGFKHVRLRLAQDPASATWTYLDGQIQDTLDNGMIPIIANQSHTFEDNPNTITQAAWVQWWADTALHYKDYPYELMFDLIVEIAASSPLSSEPIDQLNEAYEQAVTAIRNSGGNNAERIVIFSAHRRSDATKMEQLDIPTKGNGYLIGEFHEGYASGPSTDPTNPHYYWHGSDAEIKLMSDRADAAIAWSKSTGIPVWEGAWMPGNYNKGDDYQINRQIAFLTDFIGVLNERNIPHAVNATKKFYDVATNQWNELETVVDAIIALQPAMNTAPVFKSNTFVKAQATEGTPYSDSLSADATDIESIQLIFKKITGPAWLTIAENGALSGTPATADVGLNSFQIEVIDEQGLIDTATLEITVAEKTEIPNVEVPLQSSTGGSFSILVLFMLFIKAWRSFDQHITSK